MESSAFAYGPPTTKVPSGYYITLWRRESRKTIAQISSNTPWSMQSMMMMTQMTGTSLVWVTKEELHVKLKSLYALLCVEMMNRNRICVTFSTRFSLNLWSLCHNRQVSLEFTNSACGSWIPKASSSSRASFQRRRCSHFVGKTLFTIQGLGPSKSSNTFEFCHR